MLNGPRCVHPGEHHNRCRVHGHTLLSSLSPPWPPPPCPDDLFDSAGPAAPPSRPCASNSATPFTSSKSPPIPGHCCRPPPGGLGSSGSSICERRGEPGADLLGEAGALQSAAIPKGRGGGKSAASEGRPAHINEPMLIVARFMFFSLYSSFGSPEG